MTKQILLIDDDHDIHQQIRVTVKTAGYELISAYDGNDGLEKILQKNPDLVILDFLMPNKNGLETFQELMTHPRFQAYKSIPVIMLTALSSAQSEIDEVLESGINAYLEKPFGSRELLNVINNSLIINKIKVKKNKLAEVLETTKNFLEGLIESCPVAILTTDLDERITFTNKATHTILGYDSTELIGKTIATLFSGKKYSPLEKLQNGEPNISNFADELQVETKLGEKVFMGITFSLLFNEQENVQGLLIVGQDLTSQKKLERELLEKERLQAITESFATINHQLNNPLTPIIGNVQLMQKDRNSLSQDHLKKLEIIEINAKRISGIIQKFNQESATLSKTPYYGNINMLEIER